MKTILPLFALFLIASNCLEAQPTPGTPSAGSTATGANEKGKPMPGVPLPSERVQIHRTITNGFVHPGIGLTAEILQRARAEIIAGKEPWYSCYRNFALHPHSALDVKCRNQSAKDPGMPDSDTFNSQGMEARLGQDAGKAQQQALMYYFTGEEKYRANAMNIIRVWSKMAPAKYSPYQDCHIHSGYPLKAMVTAAEIMRYTACDSPELVWTDDDTANLTRNLVDPMVSTFMNQNGWFMNQNNFALLGAMSGFIFTSNREGYNQRVEWFTVNRDAPNQGWNGSIKQLARLVDTDARTGKRVAKPVVQLVEMGRDQAHGAEDLNLFVNISKMMMAQGTKVDPVLGTVSTGTDAVGPYEFLNDRILAVADYFCRYMLGYDTPWIPVAFNVSPGGETKGIYPRLSDQYRGRMTTFGFWDLYFYYTYVRGVDVAKVAPYLYEAFTKRISDLDWVSLPEGAEAEGAALLLPPAAPDVVEVERRYTSFGKNSTKTTDGSDAMVRIAPNKAGTKIAILSSASDSKTIGLRIRTTGTAQVEMSGFASPWILPNTHGEWRYVSYTMGEFEKLDNLVYFRIQASPKRRIELDKLLLKPTAGLIAPRYNQGGMTMNGVGYVGGPLRFDFSAVASGTRQDVSYRSQDLPERAELDPKTGAFLWCPAKQGSYSFIIEAENGETVAPKLVKVLVAPNRDAAVRKVGSTYRSDAEYVKSTLDEYKRVYEEVAASLKTADQDAFSVQLARLEQAAGALELLTPKLADGTMDYTRCAVSPDIGKSIALLADGNDDTFPLYTLAKDRNHTVDFGPNFQFSADAFAMEGRLNFEDRMVDTVFFGSNDAKEWTRLTPKGTVFTTEMCRVEVDPALRNSRYRFLRVQKLSGGLFEPSELRIYGKRFETVSTP